MFNWRIRQGLFGTKDTLYLTYSYMVCGDNKPTGWNLSKYTKRLQNFSNSNKISIQDIVYKYYLIRILQYIDKYYTNRD